MIFTINVTDWIQGVDKDRPTSTQIWTSTLSILELLKVNFTTATFFVDYNVAKKYPVLIRKMVNSGHEVACYIIPKDNNGKANAYQIASTLELLENIIEDKVIGIRVAGMNAENNDFYPYCALLEKLGIKYDSSLYISPNQPKAIESNTSLAAFEKHQITEYELPESIHFGDHSFRQKPYFMTYYAVKKTLPKHGVFHMQSYDTNLNEYNDIKDVIDIPTNKKSDFKGRKSVDTKLQKLLRDFPFDSFSGSYYKSL